MKNNEANGSVPAAEEGKVDVIDTMTQLYTSGVERLAEIQKYGLETAVRHNAEMAATWKKFAPAAPAAVWLELANTAFERFAQTEKGAIDLMVEQTHAFTKLVKERNVKATDAFGEAKERTREAIEHSVAVQKTAIDYTAKQAKAAFATAKQQLGYADTPVGAAADSMERGMDVVIEAHKELLDLIAEPAVR